MKNGEGVFVTQAGSYQGNFSNDLLNGDGTFIWKDGKMYKGNFLNSMFHGQGEMYYPTNQRAKGEWASNHNIALVDLKNDAGVA